jgi:hypothetical protein
MEGAATPAALTFDTEIANYRIKQCLGRFSCGFYYWATNQLDQKVYLILEWCPEYAQRQSDQSLRVTSEHQHSFSQKIAELSKPALINGYLPTLAVLSHFNTVYQVYSVEQIESKVETAIELKALLKGLTIVPNLHQDLVDGFSFYSPSKGWQFIHPWSVNKGECLSKKQLLLSQLCRDKQVLEQWTQFDTERRQQALGAIEPALVELISEADDDLLSLFKYFQIATRKRNKSMLWLCVLVLGAVIAVASYFAIKPQPLPCMADNSCPPQIQTLDVAEQLSIATEYRQQYLFLRQQMQALTKQIGEVDLHSEVEALFIALNYQVRLDQVAELEKQATQKFQRDQYQQALNLFHLATTQLQQMFAELQALPELSSLKQQTTNANTLLGNIDALYMPKGLLELEAYNQQAWQKLEKNPASWLEQYQAQLQQYIAGVDAMNEIVNANQVIRNSYEQASALPKAATKDLMAITELNALEVSIKQTSSIDKLKDYALQLTKQAAQYQSLLALTQGAKEATKNLKNSEQDLIIALKPLKIKEYNSQYQAHLKSLWNDGNINAFIEHSDKYTDENRQLTKLAKQHYNDQQSVNSKLEALKMWQQKGKLSSAEFEQYQQNSRRLYAKKVIDLASSTPKLKVMLKTITDKLFSLDNQYQAYQLDYQNWLLDVEAKELELESLQQDIDDVVDDLRGVGSTDFDTCKQGVWSMLGDAVEMVACDTQCTRTVYVSGFPYQQVDQYCKNRCVSQAKAKQDKAERQRQACNDKASENQQQEWELEERLEQLRDEKRRAKTRLKTLQQQQPTW